MTIFRVFIFYFHKVRTHIKFREFQCSYVLQLSVDENFNLTLPDNKIYYINGQWTATGVQSIGKKIQMKARIVVPSVRLLRYCVEDSRRFE